MNIAALLLLLACDPQAEPAAPAAPAHPATASTGAGLPPGHPPIAGAAPAASTAGSSTAETPTAEPIPKAEGEEGRTVAEVHAQKAELSGKPVSVRGKVVKFNAAILGTNWVHLQDGSGSAGSGDNDLTAQIAGTVEVGQVVTIRGTVATDKDFGAGYSYPVIVQDGAVQP